MAQQIQETATGAGEQIRLTRIQKLTDLADKGVNPYPYSFEKNANALDLQEKYKDLPAGEETEDFSLRPTTFLTTYATEVSGQATRYEHTLLFDLRYQGTSISDSSTLVGDHITMVAKKN